MFWKQKQFFFNNAVQEYPQYRLVLIGNKWDCRLYDGLNFKHSFADVSHFVLFRDTSIKCSDVMLDSKMVSSKAEFKRLLSGSGIKIQRNWSNKEEVLASDEYIDVSQEGECVIRCKQKVLQIVVPELYGWRKVAKNICVALENFVEKIVGVLDMYTRIIKGIN